MEHSKSPKMVSFPDAIKLGLKQYSKFDGRSTRAEYWWWYLFYGLVAMGLSILDSALPYPLFSIIIWLAFFLPTFAVSVRRLHDINRTGWWMTSFWLLSLLMISSIWFSSFLIITLIITVFALLPLSIWLLLCYAKQGDLGPNKYGSDPREDSRESSYTGETEESTDDSQSDEIHCPICNVANQPNSKFCKQCGASLKNG